MALLRSRRAAEIPAGCETKNEAECELSMLTSQLTPKSLVCLESNMIANCCEYCIRATQPGVVPSGELIGQRSGGHRHNINTMFVLCYVYGGVLLAKLLR